MFPSVFAFRGKRTSPMSVSTQSWEKSFHGVLVFQNVYSTLLFLSNTHVFPFVIVIYTHSPPCPLRVLALRPPDASSSTLFLFLVSATIKNTIRVLSLTVGQWLILKLKILTLERYLLKIKYMFQAQKKLS